MAVSLEVLGRPLIHPDSYFRFPLGTHGQHRKTLTDEALESFGVTTPLLQFHDVPSRCHSSDKGSHETAQDEGYSNGVDDEDDEGVLGEPDDDFKMSLLAGILALEKTNGKSVLKYHPYIVTR
jgi:hypothetical protein